MENSILNPDTILFMLSLFAFYWRLDKRSEDRVSALRDELKRENKALHSRIDKLDRDLREDIQRVDSSQTQESKRLETALRGEIKNEADMLNKRIDSLESSLRSDIQFVENKVDRANQRLARLEGMLSLRETDVELEPET
ncbi:MAG: hypothetical protein OXE46_14160 [Chloroflexi bacterium]|nr:hypothetical protein [Chloroflexota bacterium]